MGAKALKALNEGVVLQVGGVGSGPAVGEDGLGQVNTIAGCEIG